jgi:NAD(P)-dependent dehydrogenase (short-subunit alcohol dehydrogenase family)
MKTPALFDLTGRVAIVTGGNGGIGRGIALGLAETGAAVAIFGRNEEKNRRVLAELKTIGVPSIAVKVDVTDRAALEPALNRVESELGGVSILVNIQVNAIAPGWIETDMTAPVHTMPLNDEILSRTPAGRWGQPEEIAGTAVYLASRASDFVTGATIRVDGGYSIR